MKLTKILAGVLLLLAFALAVLAWLLSRQAPRSVQPVALAETTVVVQDSTPSTPAERFVIAVATQPIAAGQIISEADIGFIESAEKDPGSFLKKSDLVGKSALIAIAPEQVLLEQHLASGLSLQLDSGQRAVSIAVKEAMAAGNYIRPGDFVDVFFTLQEDGREPQLDTQTRLLLARSRVLAYGSHTVENPPATIAQREAEQDKEGRQRSETRSRAEVANTAVLAVPLEDVQRLTLAEKYGQLNLALRNPNDMEMPDSSLFAELPAALRPTKGGLKNTDQLAAVDKAYAGLRWVDLAKGGVQVKGAALHLEAKAKSSRSTGNISASSVELVQGNAVKTVRY